jgi:hypothetical protein
MAGPAASWCSTDPISLWIESAESRLSDAAGARSWRSPETWIEDQTDPAPRLCVGWRDACEPERDGSRLGVTLVRTM